MSLKMWECGIKRSDQPSFWQVHRQHCCWDFVKYQSYRIAISRSGTATDRRTVLKISTQIDLASSYAVPRIGWTESPTILNYAKLCVELNQTGAAICEMWGELATRHIVFEWFMLNWGLPRFRRESVRDWSSYRHLAWHTDLLGPILCIHRLMWYIIVELHFVLINQ